MCCRGYILSPWIAVMCCSPLWYHVLTTMCIQAGFWLAGLMSGYAKQLYLGACNLEQLPYWVHACRYCIAFAVQFWKASQPLYHQTRQSWQNSRHRTALVTRAGASTLRFNTGLARRRSCSPVFESISAWPKKLAVASTVHECFLLLFRCSAYDYIACARVLMLMLRGSIIMYTKWCDVGLLHWCLWFCCVESVCWTRQMFATCLVTTTEQWCYRAMTNQSVYGGIWMLSC